MVLRIMEFIALYSEMDYIITCNTGITKWYANIYDKMIERDECTLQSSEPKRGFYKNEPMDELYVKWMYICHHPPQNYYKIGRCIFRRCI